MNKGQVDYAERKAMELFDRWNDVTGIFEPASGYYSEIEAVIGDAVHCGIQMALLGRIVIKDGNVVRGDVPVKKKTKLEDALYNLIEVGEACVRCNRPESDVLWCTTNHKITVGMLLALKTLSKNSPNTPTSPREKSDEE